MLRSRPPRKATLGRDELAYLAGGPPRVVNAALAELVVRGTVRISTDQRVRIVAGKAVPEGPVEKAMAEALRAAPDGLGAFELHRLVQHDVERFTAHRPRRSLTILAVIATAGLSAILVLTGTSVLRPTPAASAAVAVFALSAAGCLLTRHAVGQGSRLLRKARLARPHADRTSGEPADVVGPRVALYGLSELPNRRARDALGHRPPPVVRRRRRARQGSFLRAPEPILLGQGENMNNAGDGGGGGEGGG
ncbi:TIGR04222 domain-containing membrane protein [Streptosporangium sp. CA-115845]|uniref:TIGR04222 domain-containing membrane protein n=1 Tax=Streptosporangium sp. CA-115845 TaxID=3240071 RepID=UPI003D90B596